MSQETLPEHYVIITMFKVLVKTNSIKMRYVGGWEQFAADYDYMEMPIGGLVPLSAMSYTDVVHLESSISDKGLVAGDDFAIADQSLGVINGCKNIEVVKVTTNDAAGNHELVAYYSPN